MRGDAMKRTINVRLSQSWQVPQKPGKDGKQYPPIVETLVVELNDIPLDQLGSTYTELNGELFRARLNHMKSIKQRSPVDDFVKDF